MNVDTLYRHNYSQAMRDALGSYNGPYKLSVDRGPNDQALLTLNLPATQQGHFLKGQTAIKVRRVRTCEASVHIRSDVPSIKESS